MWHQVIRLDQHPFQKAVGFMLDGLHVMFHWDGAKEIGEVFAEQTETGTVRQKDKCIPVPHELPTHFQSRTIRVDCAPPVQFIHNIGRIHNNHRSTHELNGADAALKNVSLD